MGTRSLNTEKGGFRVLDKKREKKDRLMFLIDRFWDKLFGDGEI